MTAPRLMNLRAARGEMIPLRTKGREEIDGCPPWAALLLKEARKRAVKKGIECKIDRHYMTLMVRIADGKCQISGIPFDFSSVDGQRRRALCPSLDRKDSSKGYVRGNVRLVVYAVNAAMNEWGFNTLLAVARGVVSKHG